MHRLSGCTAPAIVVLPCQDISGIGIWIFIVYPEQFNPRVLFTKRQYMKNSREIGPFTSGRSELQSAILVPAGYPCSYRGPFSNGAGDSMPIYIYVVWGYTIPVNCGSSPPGAVTVPRRMQGGIHRQRPGVARPKRSRGVKDPEPVKRRGGTGMLFRDPLVKEKIHWEIMS